MDFNLGHYGLVIVLEASGQENAYHPDFLESA